MATVGRLRPTPGVINQIPGQVVMSADVRHWSPEGLAEIASRAEKVIRRAATEERVEIAIETIQDVPPTRFDDRIVALVERAVGDLGVPARRLVACAAHDAKYLADIAPTAMLFVRTVGGKSHCESEAIEWDDAGLAAEALMRVVLTLAEEG